MSDTTNVTGVESDAQVSVNAVEILCKTEMEKFIHCENDVKIEYNSSFFFPS